MKLRECTMLLDDVSLGFEAVENLKDCTGHLIIRGKSDM
jgi:hypothetical protein